MAKNIISNIAILSLPILTWVGVIQYITIDERHTYCYQYHVQDACDEITVDPFEGM